MTPDISCVKCRTQLIDYAAGTLPVETRDVMARHLESCLACARELEEWPEIGAAVRQVPVPPPRESFDTAWGYLQTQLDIAPSGLETKARMHWVEETAKPWSPRYPPRSSGGRMRVLSACAAVLILAVVSAGVFATLAIHRARLASGTATPYPSTTASPTTVPTGHTAAWHIVASPLVTLAKAVVDLNAVAAVSANDVWAVGTTNYNNGTLIEHWDGSRWSSVPQPSTSPTNSTSSLDTLYSVAAVSFNDVWAVGSYYPYGYPTQTLIEHWNGSRWSIIPSPNLGISGNLLSAVAAVSANDAWAVGSAGNETLVEHWNGTSWSIVTSPITLTQAALNGVTAVSANDVWAVGYVDSNTIALAEQSDTLIEHWNGTRWSIAPSPDEVSVPPNSAFSTVSASNILNAVSAVSADDIWAVGSAYGNAPHMLAEHWNGTRWSIVATPAIGSTPYFDPDNPDGGSHGGFRGVVAISANDVWAVGFGYFARGSSNTLIEHWNGTTWLIAPSPKGHYHQNWLNGVAAVSGGDIWAVGSDLPTNQGFIIQGP
jgi:anti-sigma factor RsiW